MIIWRIEEEDLKPRHAAKPLIVSVPFRFPLVRDAGSISLVESEDGLGNIGVEDRDFKFICR